MSAMAMSAGPKVPREPRIAPHPDPKDPDHSEWRIDEASDESFPASDPSEPAMPHRKPPATDKPRDA